MKKDKEKTKVIFLIHTDENEEKDLFAYFPEIDESWNGLYKRCYSHIGQHSGCHNLYAEESKMARQKDWLPLFLELESIGYNLEVINKR